MAAVAPAPVAAGAAAPAPLASASLYVGDLDFGITEPQLFEVFSVVGPVASIRVCRDTMSRRSLGYAYVNFHNVVDAERALDTLNYTPVKGRPCRIMWKHRDPSMRKSGQGNIFIKNLDKSVDTRTLHDTFSQFGNILSCKVSMDDSGVSRGFGFVQFETAEEANEAIAKVNGMLLEDKRLFVGPFVPRNDRPNPGDPKFNNVYLKNLPEDVTDEKLRETYSKYGEVTSAVVMKNQDGVSRGFGFVNFKETDQAKAAVEATHGTKVFGGEKDLYAGRAEKDSERKEKLRKRFDAIRQDRIKNNQLVNLYIKNLDDTIDDEKLRTSFEQFGTITSAKVMRDKERPEVSKGFGFVCFAAPEEATRAVTGMNGQMLGSKPIYVALHQPIEVRRQIQAQALRQAAMLPRYPVPMPGGMMGGVPMQGFPGPGGRGGPGQVYMFPQMGQPMPGQFRAQQGQFRQNQFPVGGMAGPNQQRRGQPQPGFAPGPGRGAPLAQQVPGGRAPGQAPGQAGAGRAQKPQAGGVAITGQARNMPGPGAPGAAVAMAPAPAPPAAAIPPSSMSKEQLMQMLVNAPAPQAKQILGERLYALIQPEQGVLAGKITGMLLEGLDNSELVALIDDHAALRNKIREALAALEAHAAAQQTR